MKWVGETHSEDAELTLEHATSMSAKLRVEDALRKRDLAEDHFLELIHGAAFEELIVKLYEHPR